MLEMTNRIPNRCPVILLLLTMALPVVARAEPPPTAPSSPAPVETPPAPPPPSAAAPTASVPPPAPPPAVVPATASPPPVVPPAPGYEKPSIELSGFVAAQVTFDSNDAVRQNHLISVDGQGNIGRFGWAFDATRLKLVGRLGTGGFTLLGRAEADMESAIFFRIRHAYASISKRGTTFLLGQTDTLIGNQVGPNNFNNDWMFAQGNAYDRLPQIQLSHDTGRFLLAIAALPNVHGASDYIPHGQARILLRFGQGRGLLGAAGHFGYSSRVKNPSDANQEISGVISYLAAVDSGINLGPVSISAQVWIGAGAAHGTGGHAIGNPLFVVNARGEKEDASLTAT